MMDEGTGPWVSRFTVSTFVVEFVCEFMGNLMGQYLVEFMGKGL